MRLYRCNMSSSPSTPIRPAVLFDIDGTLVDSNYLHVAAWSAAFADVGHPVDAWRIHAAIGMDSDLLIERLLGEASTSIGDKASELHEKYYLASADSLRVLAGARELVHALAESGLQVVLATSAPESELEKLRAVMRLESAVAEITSGEDVDSAKPAPDIVQVALKKARAEPTGAIMVGDSVWDVAAAVSAGVPCIGLLSGGTSAHDLREAGAIEVYDDPADLLVKLSASALTTLAATSAVDAG